MILLSRHRGRVGLSGPRRDLSGPERPTLPQESKKIRRMIFTHLLRPTRRETYSLKNINEDTRTVVISTLDDRARERVHRIRKHLALAGFRNVEFFQARTPDGEEFQRRGLPPILQGRWKTDLKHMWGSAACALSHLDLMKLDPSQLPIIIFEDDAIIDPNFFAYLADIDFPDGLDWDICHLSYFNDGLSSEKYPEGVVNKNLLHCAPNEITCTHSYILNQPVFDRVTPLNEEIDCQLAHQTHNIRSFVIEHRPPLTSPDFGLESVRNNLDAIAWASNNPK